MQTTEQAIESTRLEVSISHNTVHFGDNFSIDFQRTLRLPDDGNTYPLPPGLGQFPMYRVADYLDQLPKSWNRPNAVFIPMYQREALWLNFNGNHRRPCAVKVGLGLHNAVTGDRLVRKLSIEKQDYMVCPPQAWLDGVKTGNGVVRQFVAMPLGMGYTVESQLAGKEKYGGMQILAYDSKPGIFPEVSWEPCTLKSALSTGDFEMGIAAGGKMEQKIYEDEYGIETWDETHFGGISIHIVNSLAFKTITGEEPPGTPISAQTYTDYNLPWFDLYDEEKKDVRVSESLYSIKSVKLIDKMKGYPYQQDDSSVDLTGRLRKHVLLNSSRSTHESLLDVLSERAFRELFGSED